MTSQTSSSTSSQPLQIRLLTKDDGEQLRRLFLEDVFTVSQWAKLVLVHHVIKNHPLAPLFILLLFLLLLLLFQSLCAALIVMVFYLLLIWAQSLQQFLHRENLEGQHKEVMQLTGHSWNDRPRSAFWVAVVRREARALRRVNAQDMDSSKSEDENAGEFREENLCIE